MGAKTQSMRMGGVFRSLEIREKKPSGLEIISWKYIEKVYEIESVKPNMLRLAPKLTKQHIELAAFSKMKIKRAAQIFSNTMQAAMMTSICSGHLPPEAYHTAAFVKNMDALFDIFNSRPYWLA